jgi:hypothetical protein
MIFMKLTMLYDFLQVLLSKRKHPTNYEYFSKYIQFSIIYLLQKQRFNHNTYSEQTLNMCNFIQDKDDDMSMRAKIQCMNMHEWL